MSCYDWRGLAPGKPFAACVLYVIIRAGSLGPSVSQV